MFSKRLIGFVFAGAMAFSAAAADIVVRIGPPRAVIERRQPRPSRNHVWVSGYHRWDGNAYAWAPGRWEQPPRPRSRWVAHHWVHQRNGWVLVEGHWR
jgi:WXXGXW repeat (2 copies)